MEDDAMKLTLLVNEKAVKLEHLRLLLSYNMKMFTSITKNKYHHQYQYQHQLFMPGVCLTS